MLHRPILALSVKYQRCTSGITLPFSYMTVFSIYEQLTAPWQTANDPKPVWMQTDEGYPSDQAMLQEPLSILTFTNTTRLMQNVPCPYVWTKPNDVSGRQKVGSNIYKFPYRSQKIMGCGGGPGDLFVVRPYTLMPTSLNAGSPADARQCKH